jgi:hypothetical protein
VEGTYAPPQGGAGEVDLGALKFHFGRWREHNKAAAIATIAGILCLKFAKLEFSEKLIFVITSYLNNFLNLIGA